MRKALIGIAVLASACGNPELNNPGDGTAGSGNQPSADLPLVVRGRWTIDAGSGAGESRTGRAGLALVSASWQSGAASSTQSVSATVSASVTFTVDDSNFDEEPEISDGAVSYGSLDLTALRDNHLRVCGESGHSKCTAAYLRTYTTGTAGAGLWSSAEEYGLPLTTSGNTVGLDSGGAYTLSSISIAASKRVVKLSDFTSSSSLAIPYSVDFTDAAASDYSTTIVVEYALQ